MKYSPNTNNINDFFSLEKTGNKKGKQTNKVNNKKSKERLKEKKSRYAVSRYAVTSFLFTPLPVLPQYAPGRFTKNRQPVEWSQPEGGAGKWRSPYLSVFGINM